MSTSTTDLIVSELGRHVDLILYEDRANLDRRTGTTRVDTGGLRCSCGDWKHDPSYPGTTGEVALRPHDAFRHHVAQAVQRRITTPEVAATLEAINERLLVPRVGASYLREMDRDIVALQAAASMLTLLIFPAEVTDV